MNHFEELPQQDGRRVIRCHCCRMVQFWPESAVCRKSRKPLMYAVREPDPEPPSRPRNPRHHDWDKSFALAFKAMRMAAGLSQREFGERMGAMRTYVSKLESARCMPFYPQAQRFAEAAGYSMPTLCNLAQAIHNQL